MINTQKVPAPPSPPPRVINIFEAYTRKTQIDMKNLIAEGKEIKIAVKNLVVEESNRSKL